MSVGINLKSVRIRIVCLWGRDAVQRSCSLTEGFGPHWISYRVFDCDVPLVIAAVDRYAYSTMSKASWTLIDCRPV